MEGGSTTRRSRQTRGPYGAYHGKREKKPDATLVHVGPGTPCGEYLRRFWQPVCLSSHLKDLPKRLRIMGEDLVAFRDGQGRVGVMDLHCCHRGTSLEFGKIQERGIRCCYHGWHFDVDGRVLEAPGEPKGTPIPGRIWQGAYPVREYRGLVFAYMGPPDDVPAFPIYDAFEREDADCALRYWTSPCNWLQMRENEMDPAHLTFLHTRVFGMQFTPVYGELSSMEFKETTHGMVYVTVRRWKENLYLRVSEMILPNISRISGIEDAESETVFDRRGGALNWTVPIDDTNSLSIGMGDIDKNLAIDGLDAYRDRQVRAGGYTVGAGDVSQTGEASYAQRQRAPGDWDAWVSQGAITPHNRENLGFTDQGIVLYRNLVKRGIEDHLKGRPLKARLKATPNAPIATYANNTVLRVPRAKTAEAEEALKLEFGRQVMGAVFDGRLQKKNLGVERPGDFVFKR
jgi:nitrite reductase/ring-hydroxylating ferredoxin subunit